MLGIFGSTINGNEGCLINTSISTLQLYTEADLAHTSGICPQSLAASLSFAVVAERDAPNA